MARPPIQLAGQRFERLLVVKLVPKPKNKSSYQSAFWLCKCDCGIELIVAASLLRSGNSRSCGCLQREVRSTTKFKHGHAASAHKHKVASPEYDAWSAAKKRCYNQREKAFKNYGARGIRMCPEWLNDFGSFLRDMGLRPSGHTLERIDTDGPYSKENCRWATYTDQMNNTRINTYVVWKEQKYTLAQLARHLNVQYTRLVYYYSERHKVRPHFKPLTIEEAISLIKSRSL